MIPKRVENIQNTGTAKKGIKHRLGEPTLRPEGGFGWIFGSLGEPRNRHFERKLKVRKKVEKKRVKPVASAGDAEAGKEGFGMDMEGKWVGNGQGSSTPLAHLMDGRAD